jgi:branched-chain amino acid transport system substrate-binding protein
MKFRFLITMLIALSLILSACAGGGAQPTEPAAEPTEATGGEVTEPTEPAAEPTEAMEEPTEAAAEPTEAAAEPTEAAAEPTAAGGAGGTIKVAVLAPLTGAVPTFGASTRDGALMAIEEWNAKGGVAGMQIEAIVEDSQCSADPARNAANKVITEDGVHYIIGEVCSSASIPVSEVAEAAGVVQISPTSTNPTVTKNQDGSTKEYVFRACFTDAFQGSVEAQFALDTLGAQTAFVIFDQGNDYTVGLAQYFRETFEAGGGQIVGEATYTAQDTDFSAILTQVADANPDILLVPDYYNIVNLVGAQAKQMGITATMLGGDGWDSPDLDPAAAAGGYFTNHYAPDEPRQVVADFVANYQSKYGSVPDALAVLAYDAANMMLNAINEVGADDPAQVKDAIANGSFEAVSGTITLDENHDPIKTVTILQVTETGPTFHSQVATQ